MLGPFSTVLLLVLAVATRIITAKTAAIVAMQFTIPRKFVHGHVRVSERSFATRTIEETLI